MHPLAFFTNRSGALGMNSGDRIIRVSDGKRGVADEFLHDGDALVTWDDGTFGIERWRAICTDALSSPHVEPATALSDVGIKTSHALRDEMED